MLLNLRLSYSRSWGQLFICRRLAQNKNFNNNAESIGPNSGQIRERESDSETDASVALVPDLLTEDIMRNDCQTHLEANPFLIIFTFGTIFTRSMLSDTTLITLCTVYDKLALLCVTDAI